MLLTKQEFIDLVAKANLGTLSEEEAAALEPYRAKNAIILVAGTCRRCAPISFDYPKPLITVRGEVLVERLIRQLLMAGVTDITLVVGFMKEKFEYLGEKFGVSFVESPEFMTTNNLVSLYHARELLDNSYILMGDQYYTVNPFEHYVYRSFYASTVPSAEDQWFAETGLDGIVTDIVAAENGGEALQGPCYVDAKTGAALRVALEEARKDRTNDMFYWEQAWYLHRDTVHIATRFYPRGVVNYFDTMDQLYAFDDSYLLHVDSPSMDNICGVLGCTKEEMHDFEPLMNGITNYSVAFSVGDKRYVYRHPLGYAIFDFNREVEAIANKVGRDTGVDTTYIYEDPEKGWKLSRYIDGARNLDVMNPAEADWGSELLRKLHEATTDLVVDAEYDRWKTCCQYEEAIKARNYELDERTQTYVERIHKVGAYLEADNYPKVFSHNDSWYPNFLVGADGSVNLIDWEYAAMSDPFEDISNHADPYYLSVDASDHDFMRRQLRIFLGREETPEEWRHFMSMIMVRNWYVIMWYYDYISAAEMYVDWEMNEWLPATWYVFDTLLDYVISLYEE